MTKIVKTTLKCSEGQGLVEWYSKGWSWFRKTQVTAMFADLLGGPGTVYVSHRVFPGATPWVFCRVAPFLWQTAVPWYGHPQPWIESFTRENLSRVTKINLEYTTEFILWFKNVTLEKSVEEISRQGYIQSAEEYERSMQHDTYRRDHAEPEPDISDAMFDQMKDATP